MNEALKRKLELKIIRKFLNCTGIRLNKYSVKKEFQPFSDVSCTVHGKGKLWFELAAVCSLKSCSS